jgi:hypothetical protein
MALTSCTQRARREPNFDVHPETGVSFEVFFSDRTLETFRQARRWLVLVLSPARLFARWLAYRAVRYELRSVSARDEWRRRRNETRYGNLNRDRTQLRSRCFPHASPEWKRQGRLSAACQKFFRYLENLERAKGFEPSTPTLARLCSIFPGSRNRD